MDKKDQMKLAEASLRWDGWGSPIGLSIFFISLAVVFLILTVAINIWRFGGQRATMHMQQGQMRMAPIR